MFLKSLIFLVLYVFAFVKSQKQKDNNEGLLNQDEVNALTNRIEFISNFRHTPQEPKEGDVITISYDPPTAENAEAITGLVNYFTIAIGTGNGLSVDDQFFMESERLPIPTGPMTYQFQLPAQMENKKYCIVYTPYTQETDTSKPFIGDQIMESLYEIWFPITGSLEVGTGPATAENAITNPSSSQGGATQVSNTNQGNINQNTQGGYINQVSDNQFDQTTTDTTSQKMQDIEESGSVTIAPAFTAFIAIIFACIFI